MTDQDLETEEPTVEVLTETPQIREQLDALESEVVGPKVEELKDEEIVDQIEAINEETLDFLRKQKDSQDPETAERAQLQYEVYGSMVILLQEVENLILEQKFDEAEAKVITYLDELKLTLQNKGLELPAIENALREIEDFVNLYGAMVEQTELKEPSTKMKLLSTGLDVLPFVGGAKMLAEGVAGKNMAGQKLSGKQALLHAGEGALWLTVDTAATAAGAVSFGTGSGVIEGAALALKAPKAARLLTRSAALVRATRGAGKGSRALYNVGRFLVEHPTLAKQADKLVARGVEARKAALITLPARVGEVSEARRNSAEVIEAVHKERQELLDAIGQLV